MLTLKLEKTVEKPSETVRGSLLRALCTEHNILHVEQCATKKAFMKT